MHRSPTRRRLLAAAGSAGTLALAGCSGGADDPDDPAENGTDPANESADDAENAIGDGNATDADDGNSTGADETPTMPEPVDWTGEERGTIVVGPDGDRIFEPDAVRITPGTLVRWLWDSDGHSVTPIDQPAGTDWSGDADARDEGHSYEFAFETPGTYEYVCEPHEGAGMRGYVVVTDDRQ